MNRRGTANGTDATARRHRPSLGSLATAAALVVVLGSPPAPAAALTFDVGVCVLTIDVTASSVPLVPDSRTWLLDGDGTCTTTAGLMLDALVDGELRGPLGLPTVGCASAVLRGEVTIDIESPGPGAFTLTDTVPTVVGPVVTLVGVRPVDTVATGVFLQDDASTTECLLSGSIDSATWSGTLIFTDPAV